MPYVGKKPADIIATAIDTTTGTFSGDIDASTVNATGDTAAGDNAAIGFTSAEGLILTGQGSTSDITVKNDADATVFTVPTGTDDILFPDNAKAMFGAGSDLQIYHDGSNSYIDEQGTGNLFVKASNNLILESATGENFLAGVANGSVTLYHNAVAKIATTSTGVAVTGAISASSGDVTITDGNLVVASGHGIDFSATGDATGMTSELLDNYEEGTFSVTIRDASSGGNTGSVSQNNKYTKVGDTVWMHFNLVNITTTGMTGGNTLFITGLPFTPASGSNGCGSIFLDRFDIDNNRYQVNLFQNASQSYATVLQNADFGASSATGSTAPVSLFDNGTADLFGTYMIKV